MEQCHNLPCHSGQRKGGYFHVKESAMLAEIDLAMYQAIFDT